jgi:enoyl-CoA hydratase/carnithine racemase
MGMYEHLVLENTERIAFITFNRPEVLNAFNSRLIAEGLDALQRCKEDREIRVLVFRGAGRAFTAGADIDEIKDNGPFQQMAYLRPLITFFSRVENLGKPVLASVHGYALGGGTELTLACDLVIASDDATFGLPEIKLGVMPGAGASIRLTRWLGKAKAMELLMTGDSVGAKEACQLGLVNSVVPRADLEKVTLALAQKLANLSPLALAAVKDTVNVGAEMDRNQGIEYSLRAIMTLFATRDQKEGMKAFQEKRKPDFHGE